MHGLLIATRPMYLGGGLVLFALGAALGAGRSWDERDPVALTLGALVVVLVHVITHYVNDAEDVATDDLTTPTALTGGSRAIQRGLVTPQALLRVSAWLAALVGVIAMIDLARGDGLSAALHLTTLLFGYAYSGRPFTLGRRGMSELDAALVMGVLVPLMGAHAAGGITLASGAAAGVLFVETVFARLCTAYPDLEPDRRTGKLTLPVLVGERGAPWLFALATLAIAITGLLLAGSLPSPRLQQVRALVVTLVAACAFIAVRSGLAKRRPIVTPILGVVAYGLSQAMLIVGALGG